MADLIAYIAHLGIVRVSFVPVLMAVMLYLLYVLAAPPNGNDDDAEGRSA